MTDLQPGEQIIANGVWRNPTYSLVHTGGHHQVLCNGDWHLWITSGPCQPHGRLIREGRCDCARWLAFLKEVS